MSRVCGTSEEARTLKSMMHESMGVVQGGIGNMEKAANSVKSGWNDDGAGEIDEIMNSLKGALQSAMEAAPAIEKALEAYAAFLERR